MEFHSRVYLLSSTGRFLSRIPAREVSAILADGATVDERRNGKVFAIRLRERRETLKQPTPLSPASYVGTNYVYREPVGASDAVRSKIYQFKPLREIDSDLFGVNALADCLNTKASGG